MAKLLLLDDEPDALEWMTAALAEVGHDVHAYLHVGDALAELSAWRPDLIVADILMPEMDGIAFARLVRFHGGPPIMFVSIALRQADAVLAGAVGYVQKPADAEEVRAAVTQVLGHPAHRAKILVVDDDDVARELYRSFLEPSFDVEEAENGRAALSKLSSRPIDLVITDYHMPVANGGDLIREIRRDPKLERLPVILLTADRLVLSSPVWHELGVSYRIDKHDFLSWFRRHIEANLGAGSGPNACA